MTLPWQPDDRREALFITDLYPPLGAYLARRHERGYDAVAGRARFLLWLAAHADDGDGALRGYAARAVAAAPLTAEEEARLAARVAAGRRAEERLAAGGDPLAAEERARLRRIAHDGSQAGQRLLEASLPLVTPVAERFAGRGLPLADLVQEGNRGLIRAIQRYDHTRRYRFATFATWWIRQAITQALAGLPSGAPDLEPPAPEPGAGPAEDLTLTDRRLHQALGREPTPEELAAELDLPPSAMTWSPRTPGQDR